ncbi:hypothetical protein L6R53_08655 [Myxococcota bacterium]|nr:hypothetical protein [Myxococcota bacterium]
MARLPLRPLGPLLAGASLVATFRALLCLWAPDLLHPVDPAELELAGLAQALHDGTLSSSALLRQLGAASAVHHGGFLPVSLTTAAASLLFGPTHAALKASAVLWSTAGWLAWTGLALRLGGPRAALLAGVALALPVPWASQWWLTTWGSHPEATLFPAAWLLAWAASPLLLGLLVGLGVAFAPVLAPTGLLLLLLRRRPLALPAAALGWLPLQLGALATPWPWLRASLTEDPSQTVPALLARALAPGPLLQSLAGHLPVPLVASEAAPAWLSAPLGLLLLLAALPLLRDARPPARLLVVLPLVHLLSVAALSPFRPELQHRYLLPWLPALLLWPALAATRHRAWAALALAPSLLALPVYAAVWTRPSPVDLRGYHPQAYLALGLDRVPLPLVPEVEAFLAARGPQATPGFAAAFSRRFGYPVLGEPFPDPSPRPGLSGRLRALSAAGHDPQALAADAGWGVAVAARWEVEVVVEALGPLGELRAAAWRGVGEGLSTRAADQRAAFVQELSDRDPPAAAWLAGAGPGP